MVDEIDDPPALHHNGQSEQGGALEVQTADPSDRLSADQVVTDGGGGAAGGAPGTAVTGVWPTPATERTAVSFSLSGEEGGPGTARLSVYDVSGRLVRRIVDGSLEPGAYTREWDLTSDHGERVAAGCYLVVLERGTERSTAKALVLK
jgi:flagellar hook assembly protein FlgD